MNTLFIHQNFPSQFTHLAAALARRGNRVVGLGLSPQAVPGVEVMAYTLSQHPHPALDGLLQESASNTLRGEGAALAALQLKEQGFAPDLVCVHPGWGEAFFLRDIFPKSRILCYLEYYYHAFGADSNFDPEFPHQSYPQRFHLRMKNTPFLPALETMDRGVCPTAWQKSLFPACYRDRIEVIHDGIDTTAVRPSAQVVVTLKRDNLTLTPDDEVVTYVARSLEPSRGYHIFMRALPELLGRRPKAHVLIVGDHTTSYSPRPVDGRSYKDIYLNEVAAQLDMSRVHFLGKLRYAQFLAILQVSTAHVYLTVPFVLSWSVIEAMSAGCLLVGSATPPVREVIRHGENGLLFDYFSPSHLADTVATALERRDEMLPLRQQARRTAVERYDLETVCLPRQFKLIEDLLFSP
jgi:glycosyltransferase involved in cell wall biosynthesis